MQTPWLVRKKMLQVLEQRSTCRLWRTPHPSKGMPKGDWDPVGSLHWMGSCGPMERSPHGAAVLAGLVTSPFLNKCSPRKALSMEEFVEVSLVGGTPDWSREE